MKRREIILASAGYGMGLSAIAQDLQGAAGQLKGTNQPPAADAVKPYLAIGKFDEDAQRVFMFVQYSCPFCAQTHKPMTAWGQTLPDGWRFVVVPFSTGTRDSDMVVVMRHAIREIAPTKVDAFDVAAFAAAQVNAPVSKLIEAARQLKIDRNSLLEAMKSQATRDRMTRAATLIRRYRVTATPSFGVAGRWATSANFTNGDYNTLTQLLNGLVSTAIEARS